MNRYELSDYLSSIDAQILAHECELEALHEVSDAGFSVIREHFILTRTLELLKERRDEIALQSQGKGGNR